MKTNVLKRQFLKEILALKMKKVRVQSLTTLPITNTTTIFQTHENYEKICYICILLCSFVCFKFSFKASESIQLQIFGSTDFSQVFLNIGLLRRESCTLFSILI